MNRKVLIAELIRHYTRPRKTGREWAVWLVVGVQSFNVTPYTMTRAEAEWTRRQLALALLAMLEPIIRSRDHWGRCAFLISRDFKRARRRIVKLETLLRTNGLKIPKSK